MSTRAYRGKRGTRWQVVLELGNDSDTGKRRQHVIRYDPAGPGPKAPIRTQKRAKEIDADQIVKLTTGTWIPPATTIGEYLDL